MVLCVADMVVADVVCGRYRRFPECPSVTFQIRSPVADVVTRPVRLSRLGYVNATLAGIPSYLLQQLQSVTNLTTRLEFSSSRYDHITPLLHQLHWLRAPERIEFKLTVLVYKTLHGTAPSYLADELEYTVDFEARGAELPSICFLTVTVAECPSYTAVHRRRSGLPCCCCPAPTCHVRTR